jgi:hypothetical protein
MKITTIKVFGLSFEIHARDYKTIKETTLNVVASSKEIYNPYKNSMSSDYYGSSYVELRGSTEKIRAKKLYNFLMNYFSKGWKRMTPSLEKKILNFVEDFLKVSLKDYILKQQNEALNK